MHLEGRPNVPLAVRSEALAATTAAAWTYNNCPFSLSSLQRMRAERAPTGFCYAAVPLVGRASTRQPYTSICYNQHLALTNFAQTRLGGCNERPRAERRDCLGAGVAGCRVREPRTQKTPRKNTQKKSPENSTAFRGI